MEGIECFGFTFYNEFDSANLLKVVHVPQNESVVSSASNSGKSAVPELPDAEYNIWTKPDCYGTEFENGNRTWFYFGVKAPSPSMLVRLNIVDLNRQGKMYSQGMAPVYRVVPGKLHWERIRDKPVHNTTDDVFTLSFKFRTPDNVQSITYFAFTYPFSFVDLQKMLTNIDQRFANSSPPTSEDDIYYTKEVVCRSLGGRDVHLLTVTSYHGITTERETRLKKLFPNDNVQRPFKFLNKQVIFVSARVHPGETPSTFVFNGFLNLLLNREDPVAINLRKNYVFKMIPFLNPDGVAQGHYRTDTRGVNLNRVYLNPLLSLHPPVFAARALIRYYHHGCEKDDVMPPLTASSCDNSNDVSCGSQSQLSTDNPVKATTDSEGAEQRSLPQSNDNVIINTKVSTMSLEESSSANELSNNKTRNKPNSDVSHKNSLNSNPGDLTNSNESTTSNLFLYLDLHGHASKKGIFMYGNHFENLDRSVECMLLPKLMSINNHNFHFTACNFTERNMYLKDRRDGMSREGSGRVAVLKLTGLTKSYTLECNYNTGRLVNVLPPSVRESHAKMHTLLVPPKYTPQVFEEVGRSLGASILDLTGQNPHTRLPNSEFHTLSGLRDWLRINCTPSETTPTPHTEEGLQGIPSRMKLRSLSGLHHQKSHHHQKGKSSTTTTTTTQTGTGGGGGRGSASSSTMKTVCKKLMAAATAAHPKILPDSVPIEKKENAVFRTNQPQIRDGSNNKSAGGSQRIVKTNIRFNRTFGMRLKCKKEFGRKLLHNKNLSTASPGKNRSKTAKNSQQKLLKSELSKVQKNLPVKKPNQDGVNPRDETGDQERSICQVKTTVLTHQLKKSPDSVASTATEIIGETLVVSFKPSSSVAAAAACEPSSTTTDNNSSNKVYPPKKLCTNKTSSEPGLAVAGPSKQAPTTSGSYAVHNFSKSASFSKTKHLKKHHHALRRLATAGDVTGVATGAGSGGEGKVEKAVKKRKKLKSSR